MIWHRYHSVTKTDEMVTVDADFAEALEAVDGAARGAVAGEGVSELVEALAALDELIASSEAYVANPMQGQIYYSDKYSTIGKHGGMGLSVDMSGYEFSRLRGLVGAARAVVGGGGVSGLGEYLG